MLLIKSKYPQKVKNAHHDGQERHCHTFAPVLCKQLNIEPKTDVVVSKTTTQQHTLIYVKKKTAIP